MEKIFFTNKQGLKLCGVLETVNTASKEVVLLVHGYTAGKNGSISLLLVRELTNKKMNSFRIDLAANGESEGKFEEQTISTMVEDVSAAVELLKKRGFDKISLWGSSAGGLVCICVAEKYTIHKMALLAPISNYVPQRIRKYGAKGIQEWKERGYNFYNAGKHGLFKVNYSFFEDLLSNYANVAKRVEKIKCPVLIIHGDNDKDVLLQDSVEIAKHLQHVELIVEKGATHLFSEPHRSKAVKIIADWLAQKP